MYPAQAVDIMTTTIKLDDSKAEALQVKANHFGLKAEQLLEATLDDLMAKPDEAFVSVANRLLSKSRELYQRLA